MYFLTCTHIAGYTLRVPPPLQQQTQAFADPHPQKQRIRDEAHHLHHRWAESFETPFQQEYKSPKHGQTQHTPKPNSSTVPVPQSSRVRKPPHYLDFALNRGWVSPTTISMSIFFGVVVPTSFYILLNPICPSRLRCHPERLIHAGPLSRSRTNWTRLDLYAL